MARPKLGERKKTHRVGVFLTAEDYAQIAAKAEAASLTPADFLRQSGLNKRVVAPPPEANREALLELNQIGRNLNRCVVLLRGGEETLSGRDLESRIERIEETAELLRETVKSLLSVPEKEVQNGSQETD